MAFVLGFTNCFALGNTPPLVRNAFNNKFPNASHVKWDKENAHEYEASFEWKGEKLSANFGENGNWLETESPISFHLLPEKIQTSFHQTHSGVKVRAVSKITNSQGNTKFEVEFRKGLKTFEVFYTPEGNEIKE